MYYGEEKALQMGRSLLPSKRRETARKERKIVHGAARATQRGEIQRLRSVDWFADEDDDSDEVEPESNPLAEAETWRRREIHSMVRDRRSADKTNPFEVWAEAITKDLPLEDRLSTVKAVLPTNLIGWHALEHVKWKTHFSGESPRYLYWRQPKYKTPPEPIEVTLRKTFENPRLLGILNAHLKRKHVDVVWSIWTLQVPEQYVADWVENAAGYRTPVYATRYRDRFMDYKIHVPPLRFDGRVDAFLDATMKKSWPKYRVTRAYDRGELRSWLWEHHATLDRMKLDTTRRYSDPTSHLEWKYALSEYINAYFTGKGDPNAVERLLKTHPGVGWQYVRP
jgi:hypothetical protein